MRKISYLSLVISVVICCFLFIEMTEPVSSAALLIGMVVLSVAGFVISLVGAKHDRSFVCMAAPVFSGFVMLIMVIVFALMMIMGA